MDILIQKIHQLTLQIIQSLQAEDYDNLEQLLNQREFAMAKVDTFRSNDPNYEYGEEEKRLLAETIRLDENVRERLMTNLERVRSTLTQVRNTKKVAQKYAPYSKQTSGYFFDHKE